MLRAGTGDIYGIPRAEWMKLQVREVQLFSCRWCVRMQGSAGSSGAACIHIVQGASVGAGILLPSMQGLSGCQLWWFRQPL